MVPITTLLKMIENFGQSRFAAGTHYGTPVGRALENEAEHLFHDIKLFLLEEEKKGEKK